jgi:hypothetical protein
VKAHVHESTMVCTLRDNRPVIKQKASNQKEEA